MTPGTPFPPPVTTSWSQIRHNIAENVTKMKILNCSYVYRGKNGNSIKQLCWYHFVFY